jgi:hypothetical protein
MVYSYATVSTAKVIAKNRSIIKKDEMGISKGKRYCPRISLQWLRKKNENMDNWDSLYNRSQTLELNQEPPKKRSANRCNAEFDFCVR